MDLDEQFDQEIQRSADDEAEQAQEARSKKYHIAVKDSGHVTKPSEWSHVPDDEWGDPVNYRYPMPDKAHADNAASRWGDESNRSGYSEDEQKIIGDRIESRQKDFGEKEDVKRLEQAMQNFAIFVPFSRVEEVDGRREVVGVATSESIDAHGTVFSFEASKKAFAQWPGNIREMHDEKRAIGSAIEWYPDEENKQIILRCFISKSADGDNAWTKIKEGILRGFSIGGSGRPTRVQRGSQVIPTFEEYTLSEVSLVDSPSCPDAHFVIARADGFVNQIVEETMEEEENTTPEQQPDAQPQDIERSGAKISHVTQQKLHSLRDNSLNQAAETAKLCADDNCPECQAFLNAIDPDGDGDIDVIPALDYDGDGGQAHDDDMAAVLTRRAVETLMPKLQEMIEAVVTAQFERMKETAFTRSDDGVKQALETVTRSVADVATKVEEQAKAFATLREVHDGLSSVQKEVERIAKTPLPGGPVLNGSAPVAKEIPSVPAQLSLADPKATTDPEYMRQLFEAGILPPTEYHNRRAKLAIYAANKK